MPEQLPILTLYLSDRCNSRCISCDFWKNGSIDISLDTVLELIPQLKRLGTHTVALSGGEPLLNRDWKQIATELKASGMNLWLLTSGLALAKHANTVAELFRFVTVSLDGTSAASYHRIRGVDAFDKVCEGIRSVAQKNVATSIRVTLQKHNFREIADFVKLAQDLGAGEVSFLAADTSNSFAFARTDDQPDQLMLAPQDLDEFDTLLTQLEKQYAAAFKSGFIAESPAKLRRIRDYFAALLGAGAFPEVRCNAPEFSAVIDATGRVSPCNFIAGPSLAPRAPDVDGALTSLPMQQLRESIRTGKRPECERCVCSMWRDPELIQQGFPLSAASNG
jgi:MoaA/NifB/PqqE/SkfB family radical SAM enzyme